VRSPLQLDPASPQRRQRHLADPQQNDKDNGRGTAMPRDATVNGSRSDKEIGAVPGLGGR
jgi:hypothetical protein